MSILGREQRILAMIETSLTREAPALATLFDFFNRLVRDEGPPPVELPSSR
jgi:hypothetical protein